MRLNNRVLVIDDDTAIIDVFVSVLSQHNKTKNQHIASLTSLLDIEDELPQPKRVFTLDAATQGEQGFLAVKKALEENNPYSVVFTDMRMPPGWDGIKTAQKIREIDPAIEIVIVTAYSDSSISEIVSKVGFTDRLLYLKKPFDDEEILQLADSLSMRWHLEYKVKTLLDILERMINDFIELNLISYSEEQLQPLLQNSLNLISKFLDTPNLFLAKLENNAIKLKIGLGQFEDTIYDGDEFNQFLSTIGTNTQADGMIQTDKYLMLPICCQKYNNIIVGVLSGSEIEGTDKLLDVFARNLSKVFETMDFLSTLREKVNMKSLKIDALEQEIRQLKNNIS